MDSLGIADHGFDNLGIDRPHVTARRRLPLPPRSGSTASNCPTATSSPPKSAPSATAISCEEYFKHEWNELKDQTTDVELRRTTGNITWNLYGQARLDDFFTQTQWLPRFDHYWLGAAVGERTG